MSIEDIRARPRRPEDLGPIGRRVMAEQPRTLFPVRNPLPFPVETFLHDRDAVTAWVVDLPGAGPVAHACWVRGPMSGAEGPAMTQACAAAHACDPADLGWLSSVFVAQEARGRGLARLLIDRVLADLRSHGARPCLEVVTLNPAARALYLRDGWVDVWTGYPVWAQGHDASVHAMVLPDRGGL